MLPNDATKMRHACERFGVPLPATITDAADLLAEVQAACGDAERSTAPSPADLRPGNAATLADDIAAHAVQHAPRVAATRQLVAEANRRVEIAWRSCLGELVEAFRAPYDAAAERFVTALDALGDNLSADLAITRGQSEVLKGARDAAADLTTLRDVRKRLAIEQGWPAVSPRELVEWSGFAVLDSYEALVRRIPVRTEGCPVGTPEWWAKVVRIEGVTLLWGNATEAADRARATLRSKGEASTPTPSGKHVRVAARS